eukprot:gene38914-47335_t
MERKRTHGDSEGFPSLVRPRLSNTNSSGSEDQEEDNSTNGGRADYSFVDEMYPLRIYTDSIHKREQPRLMNDQEVARRNIMLAALSPFIKSFNTGDSEALVGTIQTSCEPTIILQFVEWGCVGDSRKDMLGFWFLLHEIFPDAIMSILERRLRNNSSSSSQHLQCVECVCKLAGTRITAYPINSIFTTLVADPALFENTSATVLRDLVSEHFAKIDPSHFQEMNCSYIIEVVLMFSDEDKIQSMTMQVLASSVAGV